MSLGYTGCRITKKPFANEIHHLVDYQVGLIHPQRISAIEIGFFWKKDRCSFTVHSGLAQVKETIGSVRVKQEGARVTQVITPTALS